MADSFRQRISRSLFSVSYTHLDVYKRQIDDRSGQDTAGLYDTVEIFMENTGKSRRIQLVTTLRQDALKGLISKESPVGKAVLGRRAGDRVQVDMGGGRSYWITIRSIEKGTDDGSIPIGSF